MHPLFPLCPNCPLFPEVDTRLTLLIEESSKLLAVLLGMAEGHRDSVMIERTPDLGTGIRSKLEHRPPYGHNPALDQTTRGRRR